MHHSNGKGVHKGKNISIDTLSTAYDFLFREILHTYTDGEKVDLAHLRDNNFDPVKAAGQSSGRVYMRYRRLKAKFERSISKIRKLIEILQGRYKDEDISHYESGT